MCLEGAVIVLVCIIFSLFASSPPVVNPDAAAVSMVWSYIGELVFNMLVLVGAVKMADRVVRELMTLIRICTVEQRELRIFSTAEHRLFFILPIQNAR